MCFNHFTQSTKADSSIRGDCCLKRIIVSQERKTTVARIQKRVLNLNWTRLELATPTGWSSLCFLAPTEHSGRPELVASACWI